MNCAEFRSSSFVLFEKEGKVLMLLRQNTGYKDGFYALPAGHVDEGEMPQQAACRESFEEVGLVLKPEDLTLVHVVEDYNDVINKVYLNFFFKAKSWQGEPINKEPEKSAHIKWVDLNDLPENLMEQVALVLQNSAKSPTIFATDALKKAL